MLDTVKNHSDCDIKITITSGLGVKYSGDQASKKEYMQIFFTVYRTFLLCVITLCVAHPVYAEEVANSYFDMTETNSTNLVPFKKWTGVMVRFDAQRQVSDDECGQVRYHPCVITEWKNLLERLRSKDIQVQMDEVNNWSNAHPYVVDQLNWGIEDYWETPYEFMEISGDCEDYAISKYYSLRALGVPPEQLRIIIVQDLNLGGIIHAILGVYINKELFILDNQSQQVLPALHIYHYRPIYGVNESGWWAYYPNI